MSSWIIAFFAFLITVKASAINPVTKIEGPSSKTTLTGPDGSVITSAAAGGQIVIEDRPAEALKEPSVVAIAPQATVLASVPLEPDSAPAILTKITTIDATPLVAASVSYSAPIAAQIAPLIAIQPTPIITPNIIPVIPNAILAQNSLNAVADAPSDTVAANKTIAEPVAESETTTVS